MWSFSQPSSPEYRIGLLLRFVIQNLLDQPDLQQGWVGLLCSGQAPDSCFQTQSLESRNPSTCLQDQLPMICGEHRIPSTMSRSPAWTLPPGGSTAAAGASDTASSHAGLCPLESQVVPPGGVSPNTHPQSSVQLPGILSPLPGVLMAVWSTQCCLPGAQNSSVLSFCCWGPEQEPQLQKTACMDQGRVCQGFWALSLEMWSLCLTDWEGSPPPPLPPHHETELSQTRFFSTCHLTTCSASSPGEFNPTTAVTYLLNTDCVLDTMVPWYLLCAGHGGNLDTHCVLDIMEVL